jgi:hypothetical protein
MARERSSEAKAVRRPKSKPAEAKIVRQTEQAAAFGSPDGHLGRGQGKGRAWLYTGMGLAILVGAVGFVLSSRETFQSDAPTV